jgi:hypothetical protein
MLDFAGLQLRLHVAVHSDYLPELCGRRRHRARFVLLFNQSLWLGSAFLPHEQAIAFSAARDDLVSARQTTS